MDHNLPRNHDKLEELLNERETRPELISISETKLSSRNVSNINIAGYDFFHIDSPTNAGGAELNIKNSLKCKLRKDLNFLLPNCEDIWVEIESQKRNIIISTIYRHPNSDMMLFQNKLCKTLIKLGNDKLQCVISGDININLLKSNCAEVINYKLMLDSIGCNSLIASPTQFFTHCTPSLIDHIYSNIHNCNKTSGICFYDISDHLPIFLVIKHLLVSIGTKPIFRRTMRNFVLEDFLTDLWEQLQCKLLK